MMEMLEFPIGMHAYIHTYLIIYGTNTASKKKTIKPKKKLAQPKKKCDNLSCQRGEPVGK